MAEPDKLTFDPMRTPFTNPAPHFTYIEHEQGGKLQVDTNTNEIVPMRNSLYPNMPLKLPKKLWEREQRHIRTCSYPGPGNKGCDAAINGGCPLIMQYGRGAGPFNLIVEKNGNIDSMPCFAVYCGITEANRPTSQVHLLIDGWQILGDRTSIKQKTYKMENGVKVMQEFSMEVPDLPPFYEENKVGRFSVQEAPKKKRGRPKKVVDAV